MSVPATEGAETPEAEEGIVLQNLGADAAFGALMDTLVADEGGEGTGEGAEEAAPPAGEGGGAAAEGAPGASTPGVVATDTGDAASTPAATGTPAASTPAATGGTADGSGRGRPDTWVASSADLIPKINELSNKFEESIAQAYQAEALDLMREEHAQYFEAVEKPARMLVGTTVPALNGQGEEVLRDTNDAREWQEGVKHLLLEELRGRANQALDENKDFLSTIHASIELFQKNEDLIPGTKDFDVELANRFAKMATPYELRVEGKLQGYSIPVQPLINQLRDALVAERAAGAQASPAAAAPPAAAPSAPSPVDPPQAGIPSKSGNSSEKEDFSTLFGTLGLPNLQI